MKLPAVALLISLLSLVALPVSGAPAQVLAKDFPDPAILKDPKSGKWYTFATAGNGHKVQVATGSSATGPWNWLDVELLPNLPSWAVNTGIWAPDVRYLKDSDSFVIYYAAPYAANTRFHCVGAAVSKTITGPYTPVEEGHRMPDRARRRNRPERVLRRGEQHALGRVQGRRQRHRPRRLVRQHG